MPENYIGWIGRVSRDIVCHFQNTLIYRVDRPPFHISNRCNVMTLGPAKLFEDEPFLTGKRWKGDLNKNVIFISGLLRVFREMKDQNIYLYRRGALREPIPCFNLVGSSPVVHRVQ